VNRKFTKWTSLLPLLFLFALTGCGVSNPPPPASPTIGDRHTITIGTASYHLRYLSGKTIKTGYQDNGTAPVSSNYWIAETEVTYEVWDTVYDWALLNGYIFANLGSIGNSNSGSNQQPVTTINWRDAMAWCNALTEYCNAQNGLSLDCVYKNGGNIIRDSRDSNTTACDNVTADSAADRFRLPPADEWELAARYINDANNDGL
jgi:hypothetical protein